MTTVAEWEAAQESRYLAAIEKADALGDEIEALAEDIAWEMKNRLSGGRLSWNARKVDEDASDVSIALIGNDGDEPYMLSEAVILAMRDDAAGLLKFMKGLFDEALPKAAVARATKELERMAARPWDCDYNGDYSDGYEL